MSPFLLAFATRAPLVGSWSIVGFSGSSCTLGGLLWGTAMLWYFGLHACMHATAGTTYYNIDGAELTIYSDCYCEKCNYH